MACEVPVVASNAPGYGDFLETVKAGISTDPENSEELVQNIVELLKNPALRDRMGKAGRKEVTANHAWLHRAHQIDRLL